MLVKKYKLIKKPQSQPDTSSSRSEGQVQLRCGENDTRGMSPFGNSCGLDASYSSEAPELRLDPRRCRVRNSRRWGLVGAH